jgi:hypothetical protein
MTELHITKICKEQVVTVEDGQIFWRGFLKLRNEAVALRDHFYTVDDWFAAEAYAYADQLNEALAETQEMEDA